MTLECNDSWTQAAAVGCPASWVGVTGGGFRGSQGAPGRRGAGGGAVAVGPTVIKLGAS